MQLVLNAKESELVLARLDPTGCDEDVGHLEGGVFRKASFHLGAGC